ncbi:MAG: hypothetical protein HGA90_07020 [Alphaproteobacteria bacterium]|nr:hypothetical protein [Alphaproteobacteria bacterium]
MKLIKTSALLVLMLLLVPGGAYAQRRGTSDYFLRPQMGLWFGPVTPMGTTGEVVDTSLGGGLFFRYNTPFKPLKIGLDGSYQQFDSKGVEFGPWLRRFIAQIKRNWMFPLAVASMSGHVAITFYVDKEGRLTEVTVVEPGTDRVLPPNTPGEIDYT